MKLLKTKHHYHKAVKRLTEMEATAMNAKEQSVYIALKQQINEYTTRKQLEDENFEIELKSDLKTIFEKLATEGGTIECVNHLSKEEKLQLDTIYQDENKNVFAYTATK